MKKIFKYLIIEPDKIKENRYLSKFKLDNSKLWNFNHRTISKGVAIGLFCAFLPIPMQMLVAGMFAIIFSANIVVSVSMVWITNPITMPLIFYGCYKLGASILNLEMNFDPGFTFKDMVLIVDSIWQPLFLGLMIIAVVGSILGYYTVYVFYIIKSFFYKMRK